jgi:hypothetical protein
MLKINQKIKEFFQQLKKFQINSSDPIYQVIEIVEDDEEFTVTIGIRHKNITFFAKPEEILADDTLVDRFSPRDIRALTYLGYLGINRPKYKILAQKLSENEKISFLLKKKGEKKVLVKTAEQIIQETDIILSMNPEDAKLVGYTIGSENVLNEKKQKAELLSQIQK